MMDGYRRIASRMPASSESSGTQSKSTASTEWHCVASRHGRLPDEAAQSVGEENDVQIQRLRWLSKPSEKTYGSLVIFLRNHGDAERLLKTGIMDVGGEMAYVKPYERRSLPTRCFKCQQYGHLEARCKAVMPTCGNCATSGHTLKECTSQDTRCAACQGSHKATDRGCPKYLELLRRFNPVDRYD